jgi:polyisoprenoid-binding protein YceI
MIRGVDRWATAMLAALVLPLSAATYAPKSPPSGAYRLDTSRTKILFGVRLLGLTTQYGAFSGVTGTLNLESEHPSDSRLEIHAPTATVVAPSRALDGTIKGPPSRRPAMTRRT